MDIKYYPLKDNIGYIELLDTFGDELTIANSARVSFGGWKTEIDDADISLIRYLHKNKHMSPFRHIIFRLRIKAPEFVMRQWYKHVVGTETTSTYPTAQHSWNEISGRYKPVEEYYYPTNWRAQSKNTKQGSADNVDYTVNKQAIYLFSTTMMNIQDSYRTLLDMGISKEQARILLPLNQYTEVIWTASAQAILNFIELRDEEHAQYEIRVYAQALKDIIKSRLPILYDIWFPVSK
jgi:thymidylate synthase (FAD)